MPLVPWGTRGVALGVALVAVAGVAAALTARLLHNSALAVMLLIVALEGSMLLVVWWLGPRRHRVSWRSLGLVPPSTGGTMLAAVAVLLVSLTFANAYAYLAGLTGLEILEPPAIPDQLYLDGATRIVGVGVTVFLGPFSEEVFFRGFVLPGLAGPLGFWRAAGVSSLLFAGAHGIVGVMVPAFATGLLLAWLYRRTRSLWATVLAHTMQNALALALGV